MDTRIAYLETVGSPSLALMLPPVYRTLLTGNLAFHALRQPQKIKGQAEATYLAI